MASARERPKALAIALAVAIVLALVGTTVAQENDSEIVNTGHTVYANMSTSFNRCFAGIAGALMQRVTWFNGATLFSRMADGENLYIYAMEHFNDQGEDGTDEETGVEPFDPTKKENQPLYETGREFVFADKNDQDLEWRVVEYYALRNLPNSGVNTDVDDPTNGNIGWNVGDQKKVYIYVVEIGQVITDPTIGRDYNFVLVADTCQFLHNGWETGNHTDGDNSDPSRPSGQHDPNDVPEGEEPGTHTHQAFYVDLFVGSEPDSIPLPLDPDNPDGTSNPDGGGGGSS